MALPIVRSRDEAHLYLDLHPCPHCGSVDVTWQSALTDDGGVPARRYHGACGGCGQFREYVFRLPARPALPGPDDLVFFGGPEPSQLLDAGEWRLVADLGIRDGSAPFRGDPVLRAERRQSFAMAVAALGEIVKFIPEGADAVPETAFWTEHGRAARDRDPERFRREQVTRWRQAFADEFADRFRE
ncbi:hypothetical protein [Micromonospora echinofusca]|uniref:Uncharacterized protein n=1 Tax=Micromonospora echinofusca TaxID=47858 RepID=A0ABS3VVQ6_MICEH|nr:hypothetical protein [Micromonospora echinofusca]MBO4208610.1 hypothetical protein [Micromonospora echinofusca]